MVMVILLFTLIVMPGYSLAGMENGNAPYRQDTAMFNRIISLAVMHSEEDPDSSLYYLSLAEGFPNLEAGKRSQILKLKADACYYLYDFMKAAAYYMDAALLEKEINGEISLSHAERIGDVGFCYYRMVDYPKAVHYFKQALKIVREIDNKVEIAINLNNIGMIFNNWGQYDSAIHYHSAALEIDKILDDPYSISVDYNNIGKIYEAWGKFDMALEYYTESLAYARISGREMSIAIRLNNIGMVHKTLGDYPSALKYLEEALEIDTRMDNRYRIAVRYHNLGQVYDAMGDETRAMEYYKLSLARFKELNHAEGQAYVYSSMGKQLTGQGRFAEAETYFLESLRIADTMKLAQAMLTNHELLSGLYEQSGEYRKALLSYKQLAALKDSMFSENEQKLMAEFQTKYETEKKEKEIALLSKEKEIQQLNLRKANIQLYSMVGTVVLLTVIVLLLVARSRFKQRVNLVLKDQNSQLESLNATKDKFFAIISHDLRNPMAGIRNVARSAAENFSQLSTADLKRMVDSLKDSSQQVHELMQNLLMWARSQGRSASFEPQHINIGEMIRRSIDLNKVRAGEKGITITYRPGGEDNVYADENMVRTILRNLITNSVKFTPEGGAVDIRSQRNNGLLAVSVADTGIGMTRADMTKLFRIDGDVKSIGTPEEKGSGLGLIICKEFVEQNGGSISVESEPGRGTTFTFTLPTEDAVG